MRIEKTEVHKIWLSTSSVYTFVLPSLESLIPSFITSLPSCRHYCRSPFNDMHRHVQRWARGYVHGGVVLHGDAHGHVHMRPRFLADGKRRNNLWK